MRDLTDQEIKDAPSWTTHYFINLISGEPHFYDQNFALECQLIHRPEFDIGEHKWSDETIVIIGCDDSHFELMCTVQNEVFGISKLDVIAMAKSVKLTAEDLK